MSATPRLITPIKALCDTVWEAYRDNRMVANLTPSDYRVWAQTCDALETILQCQSAWDSKFLQADLPVDHPMFSLEWER